MSQDDLISTVESHFAPRAAIKPKRAPKRKPTTDRQALLDLMKRFNRHVKPKDRRHVTTHVGDKDWPDRVDLDTGTGQILIFRFTPEGRFKEYHHYEWM